MPERAATAQQRPQGTRRCACGGLVGPTGECAACRARRLRAQAPSPIQQVRQAVSRPGQPLEAGTRSVMERRFGHDFSGVRVHTDRQAATSAAAIGAAAYTVGSHIAFAPGRFAPATTPGRALLAHELAHVYQQRSAALDTRSVTGIGAAGGAVEREADTIASGALSGRRPASARAGQRPVAVYRSCGPALGAPLPDCVPGSVDVAGEVFRFDRECDDLRAGEAARVTAFVAALPPGTTVNVHGYATTAGDPAFNVALSCHRANRLADALRAAPSAPAIGTISKHGPVAGPASLRQAAWAEVVAPVGPPPPPPVLAPPGCATPANPDMSGPAFNPTTGSQAAIVARHPVDAFTANSAADDSFAAARASGLPGPHLGPQDAFRHCVWSCFMTQRLSATRAEEFATGHENSAPSSIPFDNQQDLHDNAVGRSLGVTGADCRAACTAAVASGQLRTIRRPPMVAAPCIGPSDQAWP